MTELARPPTEAEVADVISMLLVWLPKPAMIVRQLAFHRDALLAENARLKRGDFTPGELQNLCHNLSETGYKEFCDGCTAYQLKLFGRSREDELHDENSRLNRELGYGGLTHEQRMNQRQ